MGTPNSRRLASGMFLLGALLLLAAAGAIGSGVIPVAGSVRSLLASSLAAVAVLDILMALIIVTRT